MGWARNFDASTASSLPSQRLGSCAFASSPKSRPNASLRALIGSADSSGAPPATICLRSSVEPPIFITRCPPGAQGLNLAELGQKKLLVLCNLNPHYGRLSLEGWEGMHFAAEGQLDYHSMPRSRAPAQRAVSRHEGHSG